MGIISWVIFGLIAGILAKWIMPGKDGGGFFMTIILGVVGAVVGGWISTFFGYHHPSSVPRTTMKATPIIISVVFFIVMLQAQRNRQ